MLLSEAVRPVRGAATCPWQRRFVMLIETGEVEWQR